MLVSSELRAAVASAYTHWGGIAACGGLREGSETLFVIMPSEAQGGYY